MKKNCLLFLLLFQFTILSAQELLADVTVNYQQVQGSNVQMFKTLERSVKDFINNTSWTGKKMQNFEKIKSNFAIIINSREGNTYKATLIVQASRPVYNSTYLSPLINVQDQDFSFQYTENENLVFNERRFSGKNLIDVISFYVYLILGYDSDSFKLYDGQPWFDKALKIEQNSQNQGFSGWSAMEGVKTKGQLIENLLKQDNKELRSVFYAYHRNGLDVLYSESKLAPKKAIFDALMRLKTYENNFQLNYPFSIFIQTKSDEIFNIFNSSANTNININELKALMSTFEPKSTERWNKWK